ncbi:MAG: hypothetical protein BGO23_10555 [Solirubrobacterales bacterium 67-14]|nr:MAG: hypothetical protein BGO23_10555 [Solirubrobacterales bacterium 67-14]
MSESFSALDVASGVETLPIAASAPGADPEQLRVSYLDLLRLCLCDLAGAGTPSVRRDENERPCWEQLDQEVGLKMRAAGLDWPMNGLSMVGLSRLKDLQSLVEQIVADGIAGDVIEAGAWRGGASIMMRATLDSLGDDRQVYVADSFAGFPEPGRIEGGPEDRLDLRGIDFLSVPEDQVAANFRKFGLTDNVHFVKGFFEDTMATLQGGNWALIRLDGDTYDATRVCLDTLYSGLAVGGHIVIDDYLLIDECKEAVTDFRAEHGITDEIVEIDWNAVRWQRSEAGPKAERTLDSGVGVAIATVSGDSEPPMPPSRAELEVRDEIEREQARLEELRRELEAEAAE